MTTAKLSDAMTTQEKVITLAKDAAASFVDEFHEELDPAGTDWDSAAWETDLPLIREGLSNDQIDALWPIYQAYLVAETARLCCEH